MTKHITDSQVLGELGETVVKKLVLEMGFIYDGRGRLEAGTDGIIELRDPRTGVPLGKLLAVQVKSTAAGQYVRETDTGFEYLLRPQDLAGWKASNIPVILVLWRQSDNSAYWTYTMWMACLPTAPSSLLASQSTKTRPSASTRGRRWEALCSQTPTNATPLCAPASRRR